MHPIAEMIAKQNGMPLDPVTGTNPAIDYMIKQQMQDINKAKNKGD